MIYVFFFQAEDGIRDLTVTGVQTCALPISTARGAVRAYSMPPTRPATRRSTPAWTPWSAGSSSRDARDHSAPAGAARRATGRRAPAQDRPRPSALERHLDRRRAGCPDSPPLPELHAERAGPRRLRRPGRWSGGATRDRRVRPPRCGPAPGADPRAVDAPARFDH